MPIKVRVKSTGQLGIIDEKDYNPQMFEQVGDTQIPQQTGGADAKSTNFLMSLIKPIKDAGVNTVNRVGGAGAELARLGLMGVGANEAASFTNPFLKDEKAIATATDPLQIAKDSANILSMAIPAGKATSIAGRTVAPSLVKGSALTGLLSGFGGSESEDLWQLTQDTALGAILGAGGAKVLGKLGGKKQLIPKVVKDAELLEIASKLGVDLPLSAQTNSRIIKGGEALAQKGFFGGGVVKQVDEAFGKVASLRTELSDKVIKANSLDDVGNVIKKGFGEYVDNFHKTKTGLYNSAKIPETSGAAIDKTKQALQEIIGSKQGALVEGTNVGFYNDLLSKLDDNLTFKNLKQTRTAIGSKLGNFNDPVSTGDKASLQKLYAALSDDMDDTVRAIDPNLGANLDKANSFYKEGLNKVNSKVGDLIKNKNPEQLVDDLVKPNSQTNIKLVKEVIGDQGTRELQESFINKMYNQASKDVNGQKILDTKKLRTLVSKYGDDTLQELLGDDGYKRMQAVMKSSSDIDIVEQALRKGVKPAEGSQTAFLSKLGVYAGAAVTSPAILAKLVLGDAILGGAFGTQKGRDLISKGVSVGLPQAGGETTRVLSGILAPAMVRSQTQTPMPQEQQDTQKQFDEFTQMQQQAGVMGSQTPQGQMQGQQQPQIDPQLQEIRKIITAMKMADPKNADVYDSLIPGMGGASGNRDLPAAQVSALGNIDTSINLLNNLDSSIDQYADLLGPVKGRIGSSNPYNTDAQAFNAEMRAVSQMVGKAMEEGVLRKEDEEKYRKMLPQITDTPKIAKKKLKIVQDMLQQQRQVKQQTFGEFGFSQGSGGNGEEMLQQILMSGGY